MTWEFAQCEHCEMDISRPDDRRSWHHPNGAVRCRKSRFQATPQPGTIRVHEDR